MDRVVIHMFTHFEKVSILFDTTISIHIDSLFLYQITISIAIDTILKFFGLLKTPNTLCNFRNLCEKPPCKLKFLALHQSSRICELHVAYPKARLKALQKYE